MPVRSNHKRDWSRVTWFMQAARDMRRDSPAEVRIADASDSHRSLFEEYVADLQYAKKWADSWWASINQTESERNEDSVLLEQLLPKRLPAGAAAHGGNIAVIRKYWLACIAVNQKTSPEEVMPEQFLLGWLLEKSHTDLAEFVAQLPYWPIGMDENGEWV